MLDHYDLSPDEVQAWASGPFGGNLYRFRESTNLHIWRDMIRDGTAAARAAASPRWPRRSRAPARCPRARPHGVPAHGPDDAAQFRAVMVSAYR